jgi:hypothetical protein
MLLHQTPMVQKVHELLFMSLLFVDVHLDPKACVAVVYLLDCIAASWSSAIFQVLLLG